MTDAADGRTRHYGAFYGLPDDPGPGGRPVLVVYGNCQAESIRILLAGALGEAVTTVRIPPVFELTAADLPHLERLLRDTRYLVAQPVRDGYRDLPLGTREVAARLPPGSGVVRWPVLRHQATLPFQVIVRDPTDPSADPPGVPYHDLRTLASAASGRDRFELAVDPVRVRESAAASAAELARREARDCDLGVSDLLDPPHRGDWATINHPGNRVLMAVAGRILAALGIGPDATAVRDPGRVLLGQVVAPLDPAVAAAVGLVEPGDPRRAGRPDTWQVGAEEMPAKRIHRDQWDWYRRRPEVVAAGLDRHAVALRRWGLL